jgi:hypothetical protein
LITSFDDLCVSMIRGYDAETTHSPKDHEVPSPSTVNQVYISPEFVFGFRKVDRPPASLVDDC